MDNYQDDFKFHPVLSLARRAKPLASFPSSHFPYHAQPTKNLHTGTQTQTGIFSGSYLVSYLVSLTIHIYLGEKS